jgi:hypothetical protein
MIMAVFLRLATRDSIDEGGAGVIAIENEPCETNCAASFWAGPTLSVHSWQSVFEHAHASETTAVKEWRATFRFEEREPQQHDHKRRKLQRALNELLGQAIWRVGDDRLAAYRDRCLEQEVAAEVQRESVVDQVASNDRMSGIAENIDVAPRPAAGSQI